MKVVLTEDVKKLGSKGDVVEAADGYARNYLMPRGLAVEATQQKIKEMKEKEAKKNRLENEKREDANKLKSKLESEKFEIKVKAGEKGRLFGSVNTKDIAEAASDKGYDIDKRKIQLDDSIKSLGMHTVEVKIYDDITALLKVNVKEK
ncbi:LSU ribosomal protein L9p [Halanaerobium saccharolyticum subsp. saccharolyticum DSM 6643]|uniref:Large ribosomal subunit protein bL9 n=1 Tax=Halanaerobium saccharolyticum subsp. saccharolyticum DSM 6643 TaxID=1293054 RepID=M5E2N7_9FIRM|nr:50S ribosomal protein L9 [Halanaerobium saccharolyticum]CCU79909.1 LSU ribosomal protein L9p [Halanaerobium saccharolyticum subsp. saccharolyticum DSM 6643]